MQRLLFVRGPACARLSASFGPDEGRMKAIASIEVRLYTGFFRMSSAYLDDFDPMAPQREAALFYALFLRGHSAEGLRRDIDVPKKLLDKMLKRHRNESAVQAKLQRVYYYRKQVLAIFDELVTRERIRERIQ